MVYHVTGEIQIHETSQTLLTLTGTSSHALASSRVQRLLPRRYDVQSNICVWGKHQWISRVESATDEFRVSNYSSASMSINSIIPANVIATILASSAFFRRYLVSSACYNAFAAITTPGKHSLTSQTAASIPVRSYKALHSAPTV